MNKENKKTILEFLGWRIEGDYAIPTSNDKTIIIDDVVFDWNLLIPAISKINILQTEHDSTLIGLVKHLLRSLDRNDVDWFMGQLWIIIGYIKHEKTTTEIQPSQE